MTITVDNPWQFLAAVVLALIMLAVAYMFAFMGAFADGSVRWGSFAVAAGFTAGAVLVVMAGGGWL